MRNSRSLRLSIEESGIYTWHLSTDVVYADGAIAALYGFEESTARTGLKLDEMMTRIHPEDRSRIAHTIADTIASCGSYFEDFRILRPDGITLQVQSSGRCFGNNGRPAYYAGIIYPLYDIEASQEHDLYQHLLAMRLTAQKQGNAGILEYLKKSRN